MTGGEGGGEAGREGGREQERGKGESIGGGWPNQFGRLSTRRGRLLWVRTEGKLASGLGSDCRRRRRKGDSIHIYGVCLMCFCDAASSFSGC